jgi:hypothetical protein
LNGTVGALEVGTFISLFLFGAMTVQTFVYYEMFPRDSWKLKSLVSMKYLWLVLMLMTLCCLPERSPLSGTSLNLCTSPLSFSPWRRFVELGHTIAVLHTVYTITVKQFGNIQDIEALPSSSNAAIFLSGVLAALIHVRFIFLQMLSLFISTSEHEHVYSRHFSQPASSKSPITKSSR